MPAIKVIKRTVELGGNVVPGSFPDPIPPYFFNGETDAHMFMIFALQNGQPFSFTGTVSAIFLNDIGTTVSIVGSNVNGAACVTLSNACYQVPGSFTLTISVSGAVVYECYGTIKVRSSATAYDPTGEISVAELSAEVAAMQDATVQAYAAARAASGFAGVVGITQKTPYDVVDDYSLKRNGLSFYDQAYHLVKYKCVPGEKIFVICEEPTNRYYAAYQFQSQENVSQTSNPYLIGEPVSVATSSEITVPAGANYIIFSEKKTESGNGVYVSQVIEDAKYDHVYNLPRMDMIDGHFLVRPVETYQVVEGWKLIDDGRCEKNNDYKLVKYRTSPGIEVYLRGYSDGDILYQFQESYGVSVSFSSAIGTPATASVEGYVTAPADGYYMIMSVPIDDNVSGMYELVDKDDLLPSYWETYLTDTVFPKIYANNVAVGNHGVAFTFFTDQHTQMKCANLINRVCNAVEGDMLVNGGDIINGSTDKAAEITTLRKLMHAIPNYKQYVVRGNHDSNTNFSGSSSTNEISESEFYGLCLKQVEDKINSDGKLYYYVDNKNQKVRYIVLDTKGYTTVIDNAQLAWMTARITELSDDWTVVIFAHKMYTSVNNIDPSGTAIINALNAVSTGAKIACIVSGHTHHDQYYTIGGKFPLIITTALNAWHESQTQGTALTRTWGTTSEFAFDVFHIDTANKQIKITRIGAGSDRTFSYS